jgi:hypothetical protein
MQLLHDFIERVEERGVAICLAGVRDGFFATLEKVGIVEQLGSERVFREAPQLWTSTSMAVQWAHERLGEDLCDTCPRRNGEASVGWHFVV